MMSLLYYRETVAICPKCGTYYTQEEFDNLVRCSLDESGYGSPPYVPVCPCSHRFMEFVE